MIYLTKQPITTHKYSQSYLVLLLLVTMLTACVSQNSLLAKHIQGEQRSALNRARDIARHPLETLAFFEVQPNETVIEIWPGSGWYTEVLAPTIKQGGGQYIAAGFPLNAGPQWRQNMQQELQDDLASKPKYYNAVRYVEIGPPSFWSLGEDNSADTVLTFRNVHNWVKGGYEEKIFQAMFAVLKSGGILGVTDHRAEPNTSIEAMKRSGYMTEEAVIKLAKDAGFVLTGSSQINANPKDTKNHPKGVWTLPPRLRLGDKEKEKYLAIGESDRMTLKFRKP